MKYFALIALSVLFIYGCDKKDNPNTTEPPVIPEMPSRTETGANILACKVDGKIHVYKGVPTYFNNNGVYFKTYINGGERYCQIVAFGPRDYKDDIYLTLFTHEIETNKVYQFPSELRKDYAKYLNYPPSGGELEYKTDNGEGNVKFTKYDESVAAGVFSFTAFTKTGEKVEITEGFFDIAR